MATAKPYTLRQSDRHGYIKYTRQENQSWQSLYQQQMACLSDKACDEFLAGLDALALDPDQIPQLPDINPKLKAITGWQLEAVLSPLSFKQLFSLLGAKKFPAITTIRAPQQLTFSPQPDIFHELFAHSPLLTNPYYAQFIEHYGKLGQMTATKTDRTILARLYWHTIECGLLETPSGLRIFGGSILSSKEESEYCLHSNRPLREPFEVVTAMRTHYRIDELQRNYFKLSNLEQLARLTRLDWPRLIKESHYLGMYPSPYSPKEKQPC